MQFMSRDFEILDTAYIDDYSLSIEYDVDIIGRIGQHKRTYRVNIKICSLKQASTFHKLSKSKRISLRNKNKYLETSPIRSTI